MSKSKIISFVDHVGRVIIGEHIKTKNGVHDIKEPAVVNVQVSQENGQISVQLLPYIFREFISAKTRESGAVWQFKDESVVLSSNLELDDAIMNQYKNIFQQPVAKPAQPVKDAPEPEVIKLFDE
jgi:hypothetical protein